ncbi:MAG TPA: CusA/CzcA family heavy metal efflux RND transporter [bacterium]|nr:CusA/CzcA family heavy metal efflux RND transporter [bacterium]
MIQKIIRFSVYNRAVVLVLTGLLAAAGWMAFRTLSIDALPDITNVQVAVNTRVDGLAPEETERTITARVESVMNGIPGVANVRSLTKFGLSQVTVNFEDGTDIYRARQQVSERLQSVAPDLPEGARPHLGPITTGLGEIFFYTVEADAPASGEERVAQLMDLRAVQEWTVRPRLMTVKGVAGVDTTGGYEKQYHVQPDVKKMAEYGLGFDEIEAALEKANRNVGGGYVQQDGKMFLVQALGLFRSEEDIRRVPVKSLETLKTVVVGDVAKVSPGYPLRVGAALVDGHEAVLGMVYLLSGENSRIVAKEVAQKAEEVRKILPPGVRLEVLHDRSELVDATLNTVLHNLATGAALVVVILLLLVGNLRAALITAVIIPLSLLFTFLLMKGRGISGNLMSLGALDFGIIVDAAVIVVENCVRRIHEYCGRLGRSLTSEELKEAVTDATVEMRRASGFGEIVILAVFLPIFALTGVEGKMFHPMAAAFCFALLGALIFSFTTAPALASLFLTGKMVEREPWLMRLFSRLYAPALRYAMKRRGVALGVAVASVLLGTVLFSRLGAEFLPQLDEGSIVVMFNRDVNIGIDQAVSLQARSEKIIRGFPEIRKVFSRIGTAEAATDPMGIYLTDTFVMLKDRSAWPEIDGHRRTKEELAEAIVERVEKEIPDQGPVISQPIQMRFNELLEGTRADVAVKIFDDDLSRLLAFSQKAEELLKDLPGAGDVEAELSDTSKVLRIAPYEDRLAAFGIGASVVLDAVSTGVGGKEAGFLYDGVRRFPILIRLSEKDRSDLQTLKSLPVEVGSNLTIKLGELAHLEFVDGFGTILRENGKRRAAILINPRGRDTESFVDEARAVLESRVPLPVGSYYEWGGNFKNLERAKERLLILAPAVLVLVFLMIFFVFRNLFQTFLIFSGVPLALVGGVLALKLNGLTFSLSAGIGFIALSGIAILNGVVLISYFNQLKAGRGLSGRELIFKGSMLRLRPVLMTALVDIFGFLPMMLSHGMGAEVQKPLATVVIGGIISSTLLTLLVLPVLYEWREEKNDNSLRKP